MLLPPEGIKYSLTRSFQLLSAPLAVFLCGLILSAFFFLKLSTYSIDSVYHQFNLDASSRIELIRDHVSILAVRLNALRKFFEESENVTPDEFTRFNEPFFDQTEVLSAVFITQDPTLKSFVIQRFSPVNAALKDNLAALLQNTQSSSFIKGLNRAGNNDFLVKEFPDNMNIRLVLMPLTRHNDPDTYAGFLIDTAKLFQSSMTHARLLGIKMNILDPASNEILFTNWPNREWTQQQQTFKKYLFSSPPVISKEIFLGNKPFLISMEPSLDYIFKYHYGLIWFIWPLGALMSLLSALFLYRSIVEKEQIKQQSQQNIKQLQSIENQWETILLSTSEGVVITDNHGFILRVNRAIEDISGLKESALFKQNISNIFTPEDEKSTHLKPQDQLIAAKSSPNLLTGNWLIRTNEDDLVPVTVTLSAIRTAEGQVDGLILIIRNAAKDRAVIKALESSEGRFRSFYMNMNEGVALHKIVYDKNGAPLNYAILDVNPRFEKILSLRWQDVAGKLATEVYNTASAPYLDTYASVVKTGEACVFTVFFEPFQRFFHISAVSFGEDCFATVFLDITEVKKTEQALIENREKLKQTLKAAPAGIGAIENRVFIEVNDKLCEITGYTADELIGKRSLMLYIDQDEFDRVGKELYAVVDQEGYASIEARWIKKDGTEIDVLIGLTKGDSKRPVPNYIFSVLDITDRKLAEEDVISARNMYLNVLDGSPAFIWKSDITSKCDWFNKSWLDFRGRTLEQDAGDGWVEGVHPADLKSSLQIYVEAFSKRQPFEKEYRLKRFDGVYRWIVDFGRPFILPDGTFAGFIGYCFDITARKEAEDALEKDITARKETEMVLAKERNLLKTLINNLPDSIYVKDPDGKKILTNRADLDFIGATDEKDVLGKTDKELFPEHISNQFTNDDNRVLRHGRSIINREEMVEDSMGIKRCLLTSKIPLKDDTGKVFGLVGIGRDISERKLLENKLLNMAHYDTLTSLPNRTLFFERVTTAISQARRTQTQCALLFVDLDHFKSVNDTLGHTVGDALIRDAASRLMECVRDSDTLARLGGDEFIVFLNGLDSGHQAQVIADRIRDNFNTPRNVAGNDLFITASVGISVFPEDGGDLEELLKNADTAMYAAKDLGRNSYCFFNSQMNQKAVTKMQIERGLREAFRKNEFVLFYQPLIDLKRGTIRGFEALLRWFRVEGGLIMPNEFIPIAEETGLIIPIGELVLQEACRFNQEMMRTYSQKFVVSVNISVAQLRRKSTIDVIKTALETTGMPADCLELEITESILIESFDTAMDVITAARALGVRVSLDDFGTGYSSLSHIQKLPLDILKIDRSFVQNIMADREATDLIPVIIELAHKLNLEVVAEGIETDTQLARLLLNSCDYGQGYFISRPVKQADLHSFITTYNPLKNIGKLA